jgi:hypothetical protein
LAYNTTYDESYNHSSWRNVSAGYYDAPSTTNSTYVLADSATAYGQSTDYYTSADIDIYSMGNLAPAVYKIDLDGYTWDWNNYSYGSVWSFSLLDSYGAIVDTSYSQYSDINFSVNSNSTYYVKVVGPNYGTAQYALRYQKTGELPVNFEANSELTLTGQFNTGSVVGISGSYSDQNGTSNAVFHYFWYRKSPEGSWTSISGENQSTYTLNSNDIGKYVGCIVIFNDDDGFLEQLPITYTTQPVYEINVAPIISTTAIEFNYTSTDYYYDVGASDGNLSDPITYSMATSADWLSINSSTGVIKGSSRHNIAGKYTVVVEATDGRGGSDSQTYTLRMSDENASVSTPSLEPFAITGNNILDVSLSRFQWNLNSDREINWSISGGFDGESWNDPDMVTSHTGTVLSIFSTYIDVKFNYVGNFTSPTEAYQQGSGINISMDGSGNFISSNNAWAIGIFPNAAYDKSIYLGAPGDIFLNLNSQANYLQSYAPGSAGWFLLLHELGHVLGLKHTHDSGGTNGLTLAQLNLEQFDKDWFSIMSYEDSLGYNLLEWDPTTPMYLDVLGLQHLYGKNTSTVGNNIYDLALSNSYFTIYDAGGTNTINLSESDKAWTIDLKTLHIATPSVELNYSAPRTLYWLMGDFSIVVGSAYADNIKGDDLDNTIVGGLGDDFLYGNGGLDTLVYSSEKAKYNITTTHVIGVEGNDYINGIERILFSDISIGLDTAIGEIAGSCYRIYKAAFNRTPDEGGLGYWIGQMDLGKTLIEVSAGFINSDEFRASYGTNPTNGEFLTKVYNNVLGRDPDSGGYDWWVDQLTNNPEKTWDKVMADFSEGSENVDNTDSLISNGISYDLWIA